MPEGAVFFTSAALGTGVFGSIKLGSVSLALVGAVIGRVGGTRTGLAVVTAGGEASAAFAGGFAVMAADVETGVVDATAG